MARNEWKWADYIEQGSVGKAETSEHVDKGVRWLEEVEKCEGI